MNIDRLRGEIRAKGYRNTDKFCQDIHMGRSAFYRKISGRSEFNHSEILRMIDRLSLDNAAILDIFFDPDVSNKTHQDVDQEVS